MRQRRGMADASIEGMSLFKRPRDLVDEIRRELDAGARVSYPSRQRSPITGESGGMIGEEVERAVWEALRLWDPEMALPVCPLTGQVYCSGEWIDLISFLRDQIAKPLLGKVSDRSLLDLVEREMGLYHQHVLVG